jgi:hypothetical protein
MLESGLYRSIYNTNVDGSKAGLDHSLRLVLVWK